MKAPQWLTKRLVEIPKTRDICIKPRKSLDVGHAKSFGQTNFRPENDESLGTRDTKNSDALMIQFLL